VGPQRPSEAIRGHSKAHQRALKGSSEGTQRLIRGHSKAHQRALKGSQRPLSGNQQHSAALSSAQRAPDPRRPRWPKTASAIIGGARRRRARPFAAPSSCASPAPLTTLALPPSFSACPRCRVATRRPILPLCAMAMPRLGPSSRSKRQKTLSLLQLSLRASPSPALSHHLPAVRRRRQPPIRFHRPLLELLPSCTLLNNARLWPRSR